MQQILSGVVSVVVAFLVSVSVCTALRNARLRRRVVNDSPTSSASLPKSTTLYLNTREDVAQFVSDLRSLENDWRSIMTIRPDSSGDCFVFFVINESSGQEAQVFLSRRLHTSLTLQELQFLENELQQAVQGRSGSHDGSPPLVDDAKCLNCGMCFNSAKGYCDWCGSADYIHLKGGLAVTDKEKLLALLEEFGVTPIVDDHRYGDEAVVLLVAPHGQRQKKLNGYTGFLCMFDFKPDGSFIDIGIWE